MRVKLGPYRNPAAMKVEIEPHDTWNMDVTLAHIIHPMLIQLKQTRHGAPAVEKGDVPLGMEMSEEAMAKYEELGEVDGKFFVRWDWVLDEMIWAFEQKILDADETVEEEYYSRMSNGFRLFGKYYEALWD